MTNQRPRIYNPRDTYKYQVMRGKKILYYGITDDLERSAAEHKVRWPDCGVVQVGQKATREGALQWQTKAKASIWWRRVDWTSVFLGCWTGGAIFLVLSFSNLDLYLKALIPTGVAVFNYFMFKALIKSGGPISGP